MAALTGAHTAGDLRLDPLRQERTGLAEAVYAPGKSPSQCAAAVGGLLTETIGPVILTRANGTQAETVRRAHPGSTQAVTGSASTPGGELFTLTWRPVASRSGHVTLVTAGTADLPIAHETRAVLTAYGYSNDVIADVGVAGLHRVLDHAEALNGADLVVVFAGMEGALASVVTGLTRAPVIAVPTSTGYGAGFDGVTALLGMMATCSPGVTVVGIDNGFGAACAAVRILGMSRP